MFANRKIRGVTVPCVALYIVVVLAIFVYGHFLRTTRTVDHLETKVVDHPSCPGFDGWAVGHFFFFALLGWLYPGRHVQFLLVSLGWETFEHLLGQTKLAVGGSRLQLIGDQDEEGKSTGKDDRYWYGRFVTDNSFNMSGYILGSAAAERWWPNRDG